MNKKLFHVLTIFLAAFIMVVAVAQGVFAREEEGNGQLRAAAATQQNGFRSLTGEAARNFSVPTDMRQTAREDLHQYGVIAQRYHQYYGQARVLGGQMTTYDKGAERIIVGAHYAGLLGTNNIVLSGADAEAAAHSAISNGEAQRRSGEWFTELMIDPKNGVYFYAVDNQQFDARWISWVNAENGEIINQFDALTSGSGVGVDGNVKDMTGLTTYSGGSYKTDNGAFKTYDANNSSNQLPGTLGSDADDYWTDGAMVDAHFFADVTSSYYANTHGQSWQQITGISVAKSSVHVGNNYDNAYWNGSQMAYGDGSCLSNPSGGYFLPLSGDLDVVAHELSHAVTEKTSGLIYQNESGALNEAFSDMMGTSVEYYHGSGNWYLGEDIGCNAYSAGLRSLSNPSEMGDPTHYADRYTGTSDNGGVHTNSGIANHWFYLLSEGGQNAVNNRASGTNVQGIGINAAEQVAYLGITALSSGSDFCDARSSTIAVAGGNAANVSDAWDEVGVDEALCGGGTPPPPSGSCAGTTFTGSLSSGGSDYYTLDSFRGTQMGDLTAANGTDFDLYLFKWNKRRGWRQVASSTSATSIESITYSSSKSADYQWEVRSYSGSGSYEFCFDTQ